MTTEPRRQDEPPDHIADAGLWVRHRTEPADLIHGERKWADFFVFRAWGDSLQIDSGPTCGCYGLRGRPWFRDGDVWEGPRPIPDRLPDSRP